MHADERDEDRHERVNRELIEMLNELRVALPGVQILFAFMLVLPFSRGFPQVTSTERWVYLAALLAAALGAALLIAPSSYHRLRFRQRDKEHMLFAANRMAIAGMALVAVAMALVVWLITDVIFGTLAASITGVFVGGWFAWFWYGLPLTRRLDDEDRSVTPFDTRHNGAHHRSR
jgi:archaellum biogenesis protein FlaJ (TadC family)